MYLAIGIQFEQGLTGSIGVNNWERDDIVTQIHRHLGVVPDEVLLITNDINNGPKIIAHWIRGKDYE